ncbi:MAG: cryptochrome/photolyase family protein [Ketobacteraceae bacterium]|nr:cryptochrome/photolyase family protein [Ketobacteraceae bacterium]
MIKSSRVREIRLILGDQLNASHSWFRNRDPEILYVIAEVLEEATYVPHHIQKVCAFFLAMENFALALKKAGHKVQHLTLDDTRDFTTFPELLDALTEKYQPELVSYQQPDEYRLQQELIQWSKKTKIRTLCVDSEHFLLNWQDIPQWLPENKSWRLEFFYRKMRKHHNVLMNGDKPEGGQWNFDKENRLPLDNKVDIERPLTFAHDVSAIRERIHNHNISTIGDMGTKLIWPSTRQESQKLLKFFVKKMLPHFGTYQDAMSEAHWSIFHSRLSFSMNTKMLHPMEVISAVEAAYKERKDISISQAEGFIRQILGWREFVRAIYWQSMPGYERKNHLLAQRNLPDYFWTGKTRMACMAKAIGQSLDYAYAHHIQRLMITGNFCLLAGINPKQVHQWYLSIYIDAIEWVEAPNTLGMSLFADGGKLASKPYAAGGNYINKMSDHCGHCHYNVNARHGEQSCPFNSLYWHFLDRHQEKLGNNHRLRMVYRNWEKRSAADKKQVLATARHYLDHIEDL